jgi:hypothetical protein
MELSGSLKVINQTQKLTEKFSKRDVVLTTSDGKFNQDLLIQFTNQNVDLLDEFAEGDEVVIGINLRGKEWTSPKGEVKYFNTIEGWRVTGVSKSPVKNEVPTAKPSKIEPIADEVGDDLPF